VATNCPRRVIDPGIQSAAWPSSNERCCLQPLLRASSFFFAFVGDFALRPSLALSLFAVIFFYVELSKPIPVPKATFHPYYLSFTPKWEKILNDYKLIDGPDEWTRLNTLLDTMPEKERGAIRSYLNFQCYRNRKKTVFRR
jgi:hypothetical protein